MRDGEEGSLDGFGVRTGDGEVGERKRGEEKAGELGEVVSEWRDLFRHG